MVTPGFFMVIAGVLLVAGLATYFLFGRKGEPEGIFEEAEPAPLTDRKAWTTLVGLGTQALQEYARSGAEGGRLRPVEGSPEGHREFDPFDPHTLEGGTAALLLTELGPPDRVAPGEAWYAPAEQTHYVLDGAGRLQKLPASGAVPGKLALGQPYLRWSWDRLVPAAVVGAEPRSWTFCIALADGKEALTVAEALTHPSPVAK